MATEEQQIYQALTQAGLSQVQAEGVMGNIENESSFNVEAAALDSNNAMSYGLIQWNAASYPNAAGLVTGNPARDLADQVNFLLHDTSGTTQGLQGATAAQVAGNWANYVEVCQGCSPGGAQNIQRQNNANAIAQQVQSGNWGPGGPGVTGTGVTNATLTDFPGGAFDPLNWPTIVGNGIGGAAGSVGTGIATGFVSAFADITNAFLQKLGFQGWKDFFIRMGLIGLGVIILVIGLTHLTDKGNTQVSLSSPASGGRDESESAEETPNRRPSGQSGKSRPVRETSTHSTGRRANPNGRPPSVGNGVSSATHKFGSSAKDVAKIVAVT